MLKTAVVLFTVLAATLAGVLDRNELVGPPQGCFQDDLGLMFKNIVIPSNEGCYAYRCKGNNAIEKLGCESMDLRPWERVEDKGKLWPECCYTPVVILPD